MFQVYTEKDHSSLTKTLVDEFADLDEALECAKKAIEGKENLRYIVEETTGRFNSYGELIADVVEESD